MRLSWRPVPSRPAAPQMVKPRKGLSLEPDGLALSCWKVHLGGVKAKVVGVLLVHQGKKLLKSVLKSWIEASASGHCRKVVLPEAT